MGANDAPLLLDVTRLVWRRWSGRSPTGVDRVCLAYLRHFAPRAQAVVHHDLFRGILDRPASAALFELLERAPVHFRRALAGGALRHLRGSISSGDGRLYLNIGHTGLDSAGFRRWIQSSGVRPVYFVHDLIPITHPHFCREGEEQRHRRRMRTVLDTASGVIANSQATLDELARFAAAAALPYPPAIAAWLGSTALGRFSAQASGQPTFVVLGTIEARKNHLMLLNIWARLVERLGSAAPRLLVVGQRGWEAREVFELLDRSAALREHVVELNHCSDGELAQHLAGSRALLFPSHIEGYGLPLIEALASGVPVIASDLPVFREIGQGAPLFLDSGDESAWEAAILDYSQPTSAARAQQLQRLEQFRAPTWDAHFAAVEPWLSSLRSVPAARGST